MLYLKLNAIKITVQNLISYIGAMLREMRYVIIYKIICFI